MPILLRNTLHRGNMARVSSDRKASQTRKGPENEKSGCTSKKMGREGKLKFGVVRGSYMYEFGQCCRTHKMGFPAKRYSNPAALHGSNGTCRARRFYPSLQLATAPILNERISKRYSTVMECHVFDTRERAIFTAATPSKICCASQPRSFSWLRVECSELSSWPGPTSESEVYSARS